MYLIYWKWKVGSAVAALCNREWITYEICDDSTQPASYNAYEVIIPSPGVPASHPIYKTGKVMCELDFAYQFLPKGFQIISITGTDGKSTTAWIMYNILEKEFSVKKPVYLSGNFDIPFSSTVLEILEKWEKKWIIVVEISSFMAFGIEKYQSDYSIFTNFKPDHLNWHKDLQEYLDAKMNLLAHTKKMSIINQQVIQFSDVSQLDIDLPMSTRIYGNNMNSRDSTDGEDIKISGRKVYVLSDTNFSGIHNAINILACALVANEMRICSKRTREYLKSIKWLPHRLEIIGKKKWIVIVEDSKSTSSQSLAAALGSFGDTKNLLLIVGWSDKWDSFAHLAPLFQSRVKAMVTIGATKEQFLQIAKWLNTPYLSSDILWNGVNWLFEKGTIGDVLMLSPGCASFWLFQDYLDRANQFREAIKNLPN
jgi:UDP-N-acetylmuramoylalanine--D-glutamate ligase